MNEQLVTALFETDALRICPEGQPFWYTSGKIGPFYINTHFLYGGEEAANALLAAIEREAERDRLALPRVIGELVMVQYEQSPIYRLVVDALVEKARAVPFDVISGGERRDFFFSLPVARLMNVPHVTIYKDLSAVYTPADFEKTIPAAQANLSGQKALHIADLVTEASSYLRAWLPALQAIGLQLQDTLVVVDRLQGGEKILEAQGVRLQSLVQVDGDLLHEARGQGRINSVQRQMVEGFLQDPDRFMQTFFATHPDFLAEQLALGGKPAERARLCIEKGYGRLTKQD